MNAANPSTTERLKRPAVDAIVPIVTTGVIVAMLALTIVVVDRENSAHVAEDARTAILAEGTLSAAAATSNVGARALLALRLETESDSVDTTLSKSARQTLDGTIDTLHDRSSLLTSGLTPTEQKAVADALTMFGEANTALVAALDDASADRAVAARSAQRVAYENLEEQITAIRDLRTRDVLLAGEGLGRAVEAVRFLIIFLIPFMMLMTYRRASRRREAQRRLEEDLERQRELTRSRDEFIADLSHELRTPLTGIYGFALALEEISELNEEEHDLVTMIVGEAVELNRMIDDLLAVGRIVAGTLTLESVEVPLGPLVSEIVTPFTSRGASITTDITDVSVLADRNALRQMLVNLISNANLHGGDDITIAAYRDGDQAVIQITDDGPGVKEEVRPLLFGRYLHGRGGALVKGSVGLGTAVASTYAEAFGGTIEYRRVDDRTVFEVRLPALSDERTDEPSPALV